MCLAFVAFDAVHTVLIIAEPQRTQMVHSMKTPLFFQSVSVGSLTPYDIYCASLPPRNLEEKIRYMCVFWAGHAAFVRGLRGAAYERSPAGVS